MAADQPRPKSRLRKGLTAIFLAVAVGGGVALVQVAPFGDRHPANAATSSVTYSQPAADAAPAAYVYSGPQAPYQSRALTAGEQKLVASIFGDQLDAATLRLHFFKAERKDKTADVVDGNDIEIYGAKNASADYSRESGEKFGAFLYEMTALWQNQTGEKLTKGEAAETGYPLGEEFEFADYGRIQQRQMVEDYARRFLHAERKSHWLNARQDGDKSESDPQLQELVEKQFPAAAVAREAFENVDVQKLTAGEAALLKGIFGDTIDTAIINKNFHPQDYDDIVGSVINSTSADFWGKAQKSPDFSAEKDPDAFGTFVHELTHVWQNQNDSKYTRADFPTLNKDKYKYALGRDFTGYTTEQQAAIIEDYSRRFLHPTHSWTYLQNAYKDPASMDSVLKKTVEAEFPQAKTYREAYEAAHPAKPPAVAVRKFTPPARS